MAEVQGIQGDSGRRRPLTEEQIARKRALNIPVHLTEDECTFVDGYCTCGALHPGARSQDSKIFASPGTRGKGNLDVTERNWSEYS
jgi:hypothetical protein